MKRLLTSTLLLLFAITIFATNKSMDTSKKYRFVSIQYAAGGLVVGTLHGVTYPLYYSTTASTSDADIFWNLVDKGDGKYALQNAETKLYLAYKADVNGDKTYYNASRNVIFTEKADNDSAYWYFMESGDNCVIANAANVGEILDVRSSYVTGTYSKTSGYSNNELFQAYDADGNLWGETTGGSGTEDPVWTTEYTENTGLSVPVVLTTSKSNPVYYHIKNLRKGTYVTVTGAGDLTQTTDEQTYFYFMQGSDGVQIFAKNGYYVSGELPTWDLSEHGVQAVSGTTTTDTWTLAYQSEYSGYSIGIKSSDKNSWWGESNSFLEEGKIYWNDYSGKTIGFYSVDEGSVFQFYSGDARHKTYLDEQGAGGGTKTGTLTSILDTIKVGGKPLVYDAQYKTYMGVAPASVMGGNDYLTNIEFVRKDATQSYTYDIDGTTVYSGGTCIFKAVEGSKSYTINVQLNGVKVATGTVTFTSLPIVEINGTFNSTYSTGSICVHELDTPYDTLYNARLKWRGATAMGKAKKSYAIKLYGSNTVFNDSTSIDRSFFGLRDDNNWILDAMYIDGGRCRNRITTDLWNDFSAKPYYYAKEPKMVNGTRGHFVEVLLNGKYVGLYCMTEKLDRKQLNLKKYQEDEDQIRGVLYKSTQWSYEVFLGHYSDKKIFPMTAPSAYSNTSETWASWEVKYPDFGDGQPVDWGPLWNAVNLSAAEGNAQFADSVASYFDLPVFRDYYLLINLNLATDNHGKNMFLYSYNKNKSPMMSVAPWDMDGTWGIRWDGSTYYTGASQDFETFLWTYEHGEYTLFKRLKELQIGPFKTDSLAYRYAELRQTYLAEDSLVKRFSSYINSFINCGAATREETRWGASDLAAALTYVTTWVHDRLTYLDNYYDIKDIKVIPTAVEQLGTAKLFNVWSANRSLFVESNKPTAVSVYSLAGQQVLKQQIQQGITNLGTLPTGIYIVNGKKVIMR
jgi:hypothetical protein